MEINFYNTLTNQKESFSPINDNGVRIYTCGPTVYDLATIGNWRTYVTADLIVRTLEYSGYKVQYVMNITDVGHLSGDNMGDASSGEDRLIKAAIKEKISAWDIAEKYTDIFIKELDEINIRKPNILAKATEHIEEQIKLITRLEEKGFTYNTPDGVYFDVKEYEEKGNSYGELSTLDEIKEGARVEINKERKDPRDFALWKFSLRNKKRDMEWESPWGVGFPGWHIECSAMSLKYLGEQFDIHMGGEDLRSTHHPNEIAQSEGATGCKPFVKYWIHSSFLLIDGGRMGKSLGNAYSLKDIKEKGFSTLDLRYFYFTGHYRKQLNFTWEALEAAANARKHLIKALKDIVIDGVDITIEQEYKKRFQEALSDDLNLPQAIAVLWEVVKDQEISDVSKKYTILDFDKVLGLKLQEELGKENNIPGDILKIASERDEARETKDFKKADALREKIEKKGYSIKDTEEGTMVTKDSF